MLNFNFRKLYKKVREGERIDNSIISYGKFSYFVTYQDEIGEAKVTEWEKFLSIDLWFITIRITWKSKK